jgi:hypothetical protein
LNENNYIWFRVLLIIELLNLYFDYFFLILFETAESVSQFERDEETIDNTFIDLILDVFNENSEYLFLFIILLIKPLFNIYFFVLTFS